VFGSDGPVSASTYNILCWSISATPFSLSVRLATFRRGKGCVAKHPLGKEGTEKSPRQMLATLKHLCRIAVNSFTDD